MVTGVVAVGHDGGMTNDPPSPFDNQGDFNAGPPPPPGQMPPPPGTPPPPPPGGGFAAAPPPGYVAYSAEHSGLGPGGMALATPGKRIIARILDSLIVFVAFFFVGLAFGTSAVLGGVSTGDAFLFQLVALMAGIAYEAAFLATRGATPGKMIMSIKVIYEDRRRLDLNGALLRLSPNIVLGLMAMVGALGSLTTVANFVLVLVSLIFLFTDDRRRAIWDRIAKTIVVDS